MAQQSTLLLTEAVNQLLAQSSLPAVLTIEQCASKLSMSMTSFRRKLAQEETSYKLIQQKFLNQLCVDALLTEQYRIDELASVLGYSERSTFERAFRQKFGITPSKFRELSMWSSAEGDRQALIAIAKALPPMPESCAKLLTARDTDELDLAYVVDVVSKDPLFSGRLMGLASKAIYGKTPIDLREAIGRNLGINTVVNLAVLYGVRDTLDHQISSEITERYCHALLIAPKFLQLVRKRIQAPWLKDTVLVEQVMVFSLLGIFLLAHTSTNNQELIIHSIAGMDQLTTLNRHIQQSLSLSLFGASSLLLSIWHLDAALIKQLTHLDKVTCNKAKASHQDQLLLLLLTCIYRFAAGHSDYGDLTEQAQLLGFNDFEQVHAEVAKLVWA